MKLVKFLVNDVVVDVSYETLGGLCAVNFLSELDLKIGNKSLFRRSIILVRAAGLACWRLVNTEPKHGHRQSNAIATAACCCMPAAA